MWRTKLQFCCTGHVDTKSQLAGWATNCCRFTFYSHWLIQSTAQVFIPTIPMQVAKVSFSVLSVLNSTVLFCFQILIIHNLWRFLACPNRKGCRSTLSTKHLWLVKLTEMYTFWWPLTWILQYIGSLKLTRVQECVHTGPSFQQQGYCEQSWPLWVGPLNHSCTSLQRDQTAGVSLFLFQLQEKYTLTEKYILCFIYTINHSYIFTKIHKQTRVG